MSEFILATCIASVAILSLCPLPRPRSSQLDQVLRTRSDSEG